MIYEIINNMKPNFKLLKFGLALASCLALLSCGDGGGGGGRAGSAGGDLLEIEASRRARPITADKLAFAHVATVSANTLLQAPTSTKAEAKQALASYSAALSCPSRKISASESAAVQTEVFGLVFDSAAKRAKLQEVYSKAGAFEIDATVFEGVPCI